MVDAKCTCTVTLTQSETLDDLVLKYMDEIGPYEGKHGKRGRDGVSAVHGVSKPWYCAPVVGEECVGSEACPEYAISNITSDLVAQTLYHLLDGSEGPPGETYWCPTPLSRPIRRGRIVRRSREVFLDFAIRSRVEKHLLQEDATLESLKSNCMVYLLPDLVQIVVEYYSWYKKGQKRGPRGKHGRPCHCVPS